MDKALFDQLVTFLLSDMGDPDDRKALVENALYGSPVLGRINWRGAAYPFAVQLLRVLNEFGQVAAGKLAVVALLEEVRNLQGTDRQKIADNLIEQINAGTAPAKPAIAPPTEPVKGDFYVFISYARPNQTIAEQVEAYLQTAGVKVFRDASDIRKGADWDMTIEKALNDCDRMVLLLSDSSMPYRKEVHREWFFFDQERKPIYPLYVEKCKLHSRMYAYNYIDAQGGKLQSALEQVLKELGKDFTPPDKPEAADRIMVDDHAEERTLPQALDALLKTVHDPKASIALTSQQIKEIVQHKPADLTEYRLGRIAEWSEPRYQLDNRFINLTLLIDQGEDAQGVRWQAQEHRRFNDLRDILKEFSDNPALVLLGAPGSGKSTLLRRFQLDDAIDRLRDDGEGLSFFIQLNNYRDGSSPRDWLNTEWKRRYPTLPPFNQLLDEGKLLLLLDALNEMPHRSPAEYHEKVGLWKAFIQEIVPAGNRVILSCRSLEYSASLSSSDLRVPQIVVQPMSDEQVRDFLSAYLPAKADTIWQALTGTPQLEVFRVPFFLKLLVEQVELTEDIPKGKASLFTNYVRGALKREIGRGNSLFLPNGLLNERDHNKLTNNKWRNAVDLPERGLLIPSLTTLAFQMQEKGLDSDGAQIRIDFDDACDLLKQDRDEDILKAGVALNVLDEDVAEGEILFFHQLLQEFFAARKLAQQPNPALVQSEWRADLVKPSLDDTISTLSDSDPMPPLAATGWEETTVLAAAMSGTPDAFVKALIPVNLPLAARCAAAPEVSISPALKHEIQQALIARTQDMTADLRARIAAGNALGNLGDPRFIRKTGTHGDYLLPPMVTIPAGTYPIGDDNNDYDREKPAHTVEINTYQIGQFPVTNAEYALFMAAGGYEDERWWDTPNLLAWLHGKGPTDGQKANYRDLWNILQSWSTDGIRGLIRQNRITSEQADQWIDLKAWKKDRLEEQLDEWYPSGKIYRQPEYWDDTTYNNPLQPVVGICWFEARAYCKWLSAQTGTHFELPTEVQFEAAARGLEGRAYPYGAKFMVSRCNTFESHIRRTTPIGLFDNATPEGVYDLTGNAYAWTTSIYNSQQFPYPYKADDGRENLNSIAERVLRGGAWGIIQHDARSAARFSSDPAYRYYLIGFRVGHPHSYMNS